MRNLSDAFMAALTSDTLQIVELYEIALVNGTTYYYTSHNEDITWNGQTYIAAVPVNRSEAGYRHTGEFDDIEFAIGNISGELKSKVSGNALEACEFTMRRIRLNATYAADEEIVMGPWSADISFDRHKIALSCRPLADNQNIMVPAHQYQEPCNYTLFEEGCTLDRDTYAYAGTVTGGTSIALLDSTCGTLYQASFDNGDEDNPIEIGDALTGSVAGDGVCINIIYLTSSTGIIWYAENTSQFIDDEVITGGGNTIDVNGTPAEDVTFWELGEVEITSGANNGERRQIFSQSGSTRVLMWALPNSLSPGDTYNIYTGCDGVSSTCKYRFANEFNFRGFPYIPRIEDTLSVNR